MSFTHTLENKILDHIFGGEPFARPANLHVGLSLTEIQDDGSGITEPDAEAGYERVLISNDSTTWQLAETDSEAGRGVKTNAIPIQFPEPTEEWGMVTHFFLADGELLLGHGTLCQPVTIHAGVVAQFAPGELVITLD